VICFVVICCDLLCEDRKLASFLVVFYSRLSHRDSACGVVQDESYNRINNNKVRGSLLGWFALLTCDNDSPRLDHSCLFVAAKEKKKDVAVRRMQKVTACQRRSRTYTKQHDSLVPVSVLGIFLGGSSTKIIDDFCWLTLRAGRTQIFSDTLILVHE